MKKQESVEAKELRVAHLFRVACKTQHDFWDAVGELEAAMEIEIENTAQDFAYIDMAELRRQAE